MTDKRIKKIRKKRMRSYRKIMQFLWAFGLAGLALGVILIGWSGLQCHWKMVLLGIIYALTSIILLGVRGILSHIDHDRKRRHNIHTTPINKS